MGINIDYERMNDAQREAVTLGDRHSLVVSAPGSGKTFLIVNRIAHLLKEGVKPQNILAITFSRTAADNMVERLRKIAPDYADDMAINTFHAITYRLLKANVQRWRYGQLSRTFEVKKLACEIVVKILKLENKDKDVDVNGIVYFITRQKNLTLSPDDKLIQVEGSPYSLGTMQKIYQLWEKNKIKHKLITFDDMVYEGYKLIRDNDRVRHELQNRYKYILVDESNDLTKLQYELVRMIGMNANSISIIGDNSQEIYQFVGASNQHMKNFVSDFHNVKVINSNINYRSQSKIVDCYNKFLLPSPETEYKYYAPAKAFKPEGKDVEYNVFIDNYEEAKWISDKIQELVLNDKRYTYGDMMILYRTNSQSQAFEEVFTKNEIPYHLEGGLSFYNRKEIKDIICYLRLINDEKDDEAWDRIANVPNRYFGNVFKEEVARYSALRECSLYEGMLAFPRRKEWRYKNSIDTFESVIRKCKAVDGRYKVSTIIEMLRKGLEYDEFISKEFDGSLDNSRIENLESFTAQAKDYKSIGDFLKSIKSAMDNEEDTTNKRHKSTKPKVQMKSMHCSKGDQAPVVFVVGFSEGLIPHKRTLDIEAERLLGYVALSRAEEEMYVSTILNNNAKELDVSSFLYDCFDEEMIDDKVEECYAKLRDRINKGGNEE
jgi:DNA helicase-2/ATP-dependent DNA helicase PcrA